MNQKLINFNEKLKKSKVAILGLGVSNRPLLGYFKDLDMHVDVFSDTPILEDLSLYDVDIYTGDNAMDNLYGYDIIFRSPSILPTRKELLAEKDRGCYITTEVQEVIKLAPCEVIGVTGSDGKTTTTTLIDLVLKENGYHTFLGGNIGVPLFNSIKDMKKDDKVILELSSFQLMDMDVSPDISIITNVSYNHLDKHKDFLEYFDAKKNIYKNNDGILVINYDNEYTREIESFRNIRYFSKSSVVNGFYVIDNKIYHDGTMIVSTDKIKLRGIHNYENICACMSAIYHMVDIDKSFQAICKFSGVPHRLEFVREINKVKWYNDSVSSSPTRTIAGINSFSEKILLIAGGYDKNLDYHVLADLIVKKVGKLILFGDTKDKIYQAVKDVDKNNLVDIYIENTLEDVVSKAYEIASIGEIVLFSPASASFDMFLNFADRGIKFKDLVNKL